MPFIGATSGTNTATPAAHLTGYLFLVWAYRDGSATPPTVPAGFNVLQTGGANTNSAVLAWKWATSSADTIGTWTNATTTICEVWSDAMPGVSDQTGNTGLVITYPALPLMARVDGTSYVVGFAGHRSVNTTLESPPTSMAFRHGNVDATDEAAAHDTGVQVNAWPSTNVTVSGTTSGWRSATVEIVEMSTMVGDPWPKTVFTQLANVILAVKYTATSTGKQTINMRFRAKGTAVTTNMGGAIYNYTGATAGTFVGAGDAAVSVTTTDQWVQVSITATLTASASYWLCYWSSQDWDMYYDSTFPFFAGQTLNIPGPTFNNAAWPADWTALTPSPNDVSCAIFVTTTMVKTRNAITYPAMKSRNGLAKAAFKYTNAIP